MKNRNENLNEGILDIELAAEQEEIKSRKFKYGTLATIFTVLYVLIVAAVGDVNMASIFGNYIALLGVATVYIAIGCFISSLTENQLVSAIATLGVFAAVFILDMAYDLVNVDWIKTILYWVSIFRRYNTFYMGVFSIADFFYYLSISAVFVFLTVRVLEKKRWS